MSSDVPLGGLAFQPSRLPAVPPIFSPAPHRRAGSLERGLNRCFNMEPSRVRQSDMRAPTLADEIDGPSPSSRVPRYHPSQRAHHQLRLRGRRCLNRTLVVLSIRLDVQAKEKKDKPSFPRLPRILHPCILTSFSGRENETWSATPFACTCHKLRPISGSHLAL